MDITIVNQSTLVSDALVQAMIPALQTQITRDFTPVWQDPGTLHFATSPSGLGDDLILKDDPAPDDPTGDLGYHFLTNGRPSATIFVRMSLDQLSVVVSHEILEMLADPMCTRMAQDNSHIVEVCDPVEATEYLIDGVYVSNFVYPAYFMLGEGTRYDFNNQLHGPCPLMLPGGYLMWYAEGQWQSKFGHMADGMINTKRASERGRRVFRAAQGAPT